MRNDIYTFFIVILIKMMNADSVIDEKEDSFIKKTAEAIGIEYNKKDFEVFSINNNISKLTELFTSYADRLFLIQQCYYLALIDGEIHPKENHFLKELIEHFKIKKNDVLCIEESLILLKDNTNNIFLDKNYIRLHNNFLNSSFYLNWEPSPNKA